MFPAMNRFRIARGFEEAFEEIWRTRETYVSEGPGFKTFALLKGRDERGGVSSRCSAIEGNA